MKFIVLILLKICRFSTTFPRLVITLFLVLGVAGFATMPLIRLSTNLVAGIGDTDATISLTKENSEIFGEQDALIVVLEFPEPPGDARLPFIKRLSETLASLPGVRRVRCQFLDAEDPEATALVLKNFLLGMNERERGEIRQIFSPQGLKESFRRNINRLFLVQNPYLQNRILDDPLELGRFVSESMTKRVGSVSLGDTYLLIASPDSTTYLIQVTPSFPSADIVAGKALVDKIRTTVDRRIAELQATMPAMQGKLQELKSYLTGKTVFHRESDAIFDRESTTIIVFSFIMVTGLLIVVYRSLWAGLLLVIPIAAGIGPNYGLIYLTYDEVNPVVMGATGVLFGLGTDYGVHLWSSFRREIDRGAKPEEALLAVYGHTGQAVFLGALTSTLAFLCLCLSRQPAMGQFGWVGASGLCLTLVSTVFLFPALVQIMSGMKKDRYPRMRVNFRVLSGLFERRPLFIIAVSGCVVLVTLIFASRISYEKDLLKVFLARNMASMEVSERISRKFHSNFSQPTFLSFDVDDLDKGLFVQRQLDAILERLMARDREISSFDSISYLMAPSSVQNQNTEVLSGITAEWPILADQLEKEIRRSELSSSAAESMKQSFDSIGKMLANPASLLSDEKDKQLTDVERSWYMTKIHGKYRFLTHVRYSSSVTDSQALRQADHKILDAVKELPVTVHISGPRHAMEAILSTLISDLVTLGAYVLCAVVIFFFALFRHPLGVVLCLIPMAGAFCITVGVMSVIGMGLPFSIVGVVPLIFGLGMDNGVHVVLGSLNKGEGAVSRTMERVTTPIVFTSLTNVMGFVAMLTSKLYSMEFLGWAMVIGMTAAVALTLTTLPALLLLMERHQAGSAETKSSASLALGK
jgi:uncharacterized protein